MTRERLLLELGWLLDPSFDDASSLYSVEQAREWLAGIANDCLPESVASSYCDGVQFAYGKPGHNLKIYVPETEDQHWYFASIIGGKASVQLRRATNEDIREWQVS